MTDVELATHSPRRRGRTVARPTPRRDEVIGTDPGDRHSHQPTPFLPARTPCRAVPASSSCAPAGVSAWGAVEASAAQARPSRARRAERRRHRLWCGSLAREGQSVERSTGGKTGLLPAGCLRLLDQPRTGRQPTRRGTGSPDAVPGVMSNRTSPTTCTGNATPSRTTASLGVSSLPSREGAPR